MASLPSSSAALANWCHCASVSAVISRGSKVSTALQTDLSYPFQHMGFDPSSQLSQMQLVQIGICSHEHALHCRLRAGMVLKVSFKHDPLQLRFRVCCNYQHILHYMHFLHQGLRINSHWQCVHRLLLLGLLGFLVFCFLCCYLCCAMFLSYVFLG